MGEGDDLRGAGQRFREGAAMKSRRGLFSALFVCVLVVTASILLVSIAHFNPLTGVYTYDPRTDQPSGLVLENRPDLVFLDALTKQIKHDGTYPPNATTKVARVETIRVAVSTYTDFQAYAYVTARLDYVDGTSRVEEFRFHSVESVGAWLPIVGEITVRAFYGRLTECLTLPDEPGKSYCRIN